MTSTGYAWAIIGMAFGIAITAPAPQTSQPSPHIERRLSGETAVQMANYCSRYREQKHFDRCMADKTELFGRAVK